MNTDFSATSSEYGDGKNKRKKKGNAAGSGDSEE